MRFPPRLHLAHLPTPIHKLEQTSQELGKEIFIWRDDMTGSVESGNKVRKLEFLLADACAQDATRIITAGGIQSNHTRAAAYCARRMGLDVSIVVREPKTGRNLNEIPTANLLLNHIAKADLHFIKYADYQAAGSVYRPFLEKVAEDSRKKGERPYIIMEGGSQPLGCFGYIFGVEQMLSVWAAAAGSKMPDALFFADGSGGTHAGLHLGYDLHGLPTSKLWAINVCDSAEYFQQRVGKLVEDTAREFNLPSRNRQFQVLDGHFGAGYSIASNEDLQFYSALAQKEGVLLDPTYSGKAFRGMLTEIKKCPDRYGDKILFLHSGGIFGTFAYAEQYMKAIAG